MAYLYRHIRLDKNEPFYIGIGEDKPKYEGQYKRANNKRDRNIHWKNITNLTPYKVEIMLDDLTWDEACQKEIEFIKLYGRVNLNKGPLCNMTDGGEGSNNRFHSEETKQRISKGNKDKPKPEGFGKTMKERLKNQPSFFKGKKHSEETKLKMSKIAKNKKLSEETKQKIGKLHKGKITSEVTKLKMSKSHVGIPRSEETRLKISLSSKGRVPKKAIESMSFKILNYETNVIYKSFNECCRVLKISATKGYNLIKQNKLIKI
jgi:hypothetical protein